MKTRSDFVSNSSSSSFILDGEDAVRGMSMLRRVFEKLETRYFSVDGIWLYVSASDADAAEDIARAVNGDDDWDFISWDPNTVSTRLTSDAVRPFTDDVARKIRRVRFESSDSRGPELMALKSLLMFFDRNGCRPDCSDSESDFMSYASDDEKFFAALATYREEEDGR